MMEGLELNEINIDLIRESMEYGHGCLCPYEVYVAIEYGYTED